MRAPPRLLVTAVLLLPLVLLTSSTHADTRPQGWITLMSEDFEGEFPRGLWFVGPPTKDYLWGVRDCNPNNGSKSIWAGGGGPLGSAIPCSGKYGNNAQTVLRYGPFDLTGCTDAKLEYAHWTWTANDDHFFGIGFSVNGTNYRTLRFAADTVSICGGFCQESFDLTSWSTLGNLCGQPQEWFHFSYSTDASGVSHGVFVDDVVLQAYYEGDGTRLLFLPPITRS